MFSPAAEPVSNLKVGRNKDNSILLADVSNISQWFESERACEGREY